MITNSIEATASTSAVYGLQTSTLRDKYDSIVHQYGEVTATQIANITAGRGKNSWKSFIERKRMVNKAKHADAEYYSSLTQAFDLNRTYTLNEIISIVCEVREELDLPAYLKNIKSQAEKQFLDLFLVEDVFTIGEVDDVVHSKTFFGYKPVCRILAKPGHY